MKESITVQKQREAEIEKISSAGDGGEGLKPSGRQDVFQKLGKLYPSGITIERDSIVNGNVLRHIVVFDNKVTVYEVKSYDWGQTFYFRISVIANDNITKPIHQMELEEFNNKIK